MIKTALISVSDKRGIDRVARELVEKDITIISSGGTAQYLRDAGVDVVDVADYTGFPEMMDGRVKTLHPKIHGGLLAVRGNAAHQQEAEAHGIGMIDLVIVNLYPFAATIAKKDVREEEAIENIDIGGPSMLRSAAKNFASVTVVVDPMDYDMVLRAIEYAGDTSLATRSALAKKVFAYTATYDSLIYGYLTRDEKFPSVHFGVYDRVSTLRYGENPHQEAALYKGKKRYETSIPNATVLQGKELSYNNIADADAALALIKEFDRPAVAVIKHANPCGCAQNDDFMTAYKEAYACDSLSAFGGIIAMNRPCTKEIAEEIGKIFVELVIAPSFSESAQAIFVKKKNVRVLAVGDIAPRVGALMYTQIKGGLLVQDRDEQVLTASRLRTVTKLSPTDDQIVSSLFAWKVIKHVKSNAIVLAQGTKTVGIGEGQVARVSAVAMAVQKADERARGAVLASDAFFPFRDSIDTMAESGIACVIQPGGSVHDDEVIAAADEKGIAMVFTGSRAFFH